jgi:L-threonylcarbamoyladenylate synthase
MQILKPNKQSINKAIEILNAGGVVIFPTDTVYGFLALAENKKDPRRSQTGEAVGKIFKIKKRSKTKPLPIFVKDLRAAKEMVEISPVQEKVLKKYWPGKFTFILKSKEKNKTIALRIPKYKFLNDLLKKINKPLAQTSVNVSGQPALSKIKDIIDIFGSDKRIDLIIDTGNLKKSKPSQIIDLIGVRKKIIRK